MATNEQIRERIEAFARELSAELGDFDPSLGDCWLDAIENQAITIGDAVQAEMVKLQSVASASQSGEVACPKCGQLGRSRGIREREMIGRRGPVTIAEPEYFCPCCRKAFFPSDQCDRG